MIGLSRIDAVVLRTVLTRVALAIALFMGFLVLIESLNASRFAMLSAVGGIPLALFGMLLPAFRWSIGILPITVLMGTMAGILDLQARQELTIMKASGLSLWRIALLPVTIVFAFALFVCVFGETWTINSNRAMSNAATDIAHDVWLEQSGSDGSYILHADEVRPALSQLDGVIIFDVGSPDRPQLVAERAMLEPGRWLLQNGTRYTADRAAVPFAEMTMATTTTTGDLRLQVRAADMTFTELVAAAVSDVTMPDLRAISLTGLYLTFTRPIMVVGAMLLAFALTARYRRRGNYGGAMLQGLVVGFVLFVLNEMAIRAGNSQVITPLAATAGPAFVSVLVGLTALLFLEDGYA